MRKEVMNSRTTGSSIYRREAAKGDLGSEVKAEMEANVGWTVGRTIGRGATSTVSLAAATTTGDLFAVKSCPLSRSSLLRREQSILSSLSSRHIISCLGSDVSGGCYHLFLELAAGGALSDYAGYLEESKIRSFTRQIVLGLFYLHSRGVAHGDVKGRNVLVGEDGRRVKLGDFGCARRLGDVGLVMGTPAFMAPEVARGEAQGIESDIWSLGCTVLEMAMGKSPWPEVSDPAAAIHRIGFSAAVPTTPEWMSAEGKDFVSNCLRRDPKERWTTEQLLRHPFVAEADEEPPAPCSNPKQRMWVSPKSSLEFGLWESATEEGKEEELLEIIKQLESPSANWSWDDSWVSVRETTEEGEEGNAKDSIAQINGTNEMEFDTFHDSLNGEEDESNSSFLCSTVEAEHVVSNRHCRNVHLKEFQICYRGFAEFSFMLHFSRGCVSTNDDKK